MAYYLRFLRLRHASTQVEVGKILGCTNSQVSKYESAQKQLDGRQCAALDEAWDTGGLFTILLGYAKLGTDVNWPVRLGRYQRNAVEHYIFSNYMIPMPFQTEDYARGVLRAGYDAGFLDDVDATLGGRMELQAAMLEGNPQIWAVLDQGALREMGSVGVMAAQRDHLIEMGASPNVSLRILPLSAAPHIGVDGPFHCFTLPDRRLAAFSGNALGVGRVIDDQPEASSAVLRFHRIAARAWSEDQTREHIAQLGEVDDGLA
ncbi:MULTISPECIES: helix-turn-helix domain-containing protein [Actinomadura]|uniref:Helix-turn-helix transcriptional regulator n=1 Tax=Actinomadura yumaensis TaxID=111807 RepID=A0ABW2CJG4_9ACTN|nr:helix-turn-helix transcriptional regulator [Actinomadura sp. J1-007]MWK34801.1 hypothetical protein [Actinomadura sp. J1-007]